MDRLIRIRVEEDIPEKYRDRAVGKLLRFNNFGVELPECSTAEMLVGMCMDNRKTLRMPDNFAYILRSGGGNMRQSEFKISYAVGVGGVREVALIAHENCGMVHLANRYEQFVSGLADAGWEESAARDHFMQFAPLFEVGNEINFVLSEVVRLRTRYPKVLIVPMYYHLSDCKLSLIKE